MNKQKGNTVLWILGLLAIAVVVFLIFKSDRTPKPVDLDDSLNTAETVVLEGEVVCLPHRDTSGPVTLECAYGVKTDDGNHYGLDASNLPTERQGGYDTGDRVAFEGTLIPQNEIPTNFWDTYNIVGMISVQDYWEYRDK